MPSTWLTVCSELPGCPSGRRRAAGRRGRTAPAGRRTGTGGAADPPGHRAQPAVPAGEQGDDPVGLAELLHAQHHRVVAVELSAVPGHRAILPRGAKSGSARGGRARNPDARAAVTPVACSPWLCIRTARRARPAATTLIVSRRVRQPVLPPARLRQHRGGPDHQHPGAPGGRRRDRPRHRRAATRCGSSGWCATRAVEPDAAYEIKGGELVLDTDCGSRCSVSYEVTGPGRGDACRARPAPVTST